MLITDRNPKMAAKAVPLECIEDITKAIAKGYEKAKSTGYVRICKVSPLDSLVHSDLTYSKKNCEWYHDFYNELQDIAKVAQVFIIPDLNISALKVQANSMFMVNPLNIHSPVLDEYYQELIKKKEDIYKTIRDPIILSRALLMDMEPQYEDFVKGVPIWLMDIKNTVLQSYDNKNRRHIKIVRDNDHFRYFTSIISDNWSEIENVPKEMDIIVEYLLSNRPNLALTNEG